MDKDTIHIVKMNGIEVAQDMIATTTPSLNGVSKITLETLYKRGHSIQRTQLFYIKFINVKSFVMMHLRTHSAAGQLWLLESSRDDWITRGDVGGSGNEESMGSIKDNTGRNSRINGTLLCNAEHIRSMCGLRLCMKAHAETRGIVSEIINKMWDVDEALAGYLVPKCYPLGYCNETGKCQVYKEGDYWRAERYERRLV